MNEFAQQLKWQFVLLQKNSIITISFAVTLIYGLVLYFLNSSEGLDLVLVSLVLNDPSVIGYFFIALAIFIERKHMILPAIFVSPVNLHHFILSKTLSLSIIGLLCSLGLAISVKGFDFAILPYTIGTFGICVMSALLGLIMLTYSDDFLNFAMLSIPVFLAFVNVPLLNYLQAVDLGWFVRIFPIQGGLELIDDSLTPGLENGVYPWISLLVWIPLFYVLAYRTFSRKIVHR